MFVGVEYRGGPRDGQVLMVRPNDPPPAVPASADTWYVLREAPDGMPYYRWVADAYPGAWWQRALRWVLRPRRIRSLDDDNDWGVA